MSKKTKGDKDMTTITLKEIETRVLRNSDRYRDTIKRGRVRPKNPTEARFSKK